jgi:hypothetical protein
MFVLYLLAEDNREIRDLDAPNEDQTRDHVQQRIGVDSDRHCGRWTTDVPAIIYDFKAIGGTMRKQRIDYWWQPAKPEPEPKGVEPIASEDWLADLIGKAGHHER